MVRKKTDRGGVSNRFLQVHWISVLRVDLSGERFKLVGSGISDLCEAILSRIFFCFGQGLCRPCKNRDKNRYFFFTVILKNNNYYFLPL